MYRTSRKFISILVIIAFSILCIVTEGYAIVVVPTVKLIVNPNRTDLEAGADPITITAQASGINLTYTWELLGPGEIEGAGSNVIFLAPEQITRDTIPTRVTVIVVDEAGQEASASVTFNILRSSTQKAPSGPIEPAIESGARPESKGMSRTTRIALGVGAAAALGAGIAMLDSDGDDDNGSSGEGTLSVSGVWSFSGQKTSDTCTELFNFPNTATETIDVAQDLTALVAIHVNGNILSGGWQFEGRVRGNSFELAASNPNVYIDGELTIHEGCGFNVNNISDNSGTGTMNVTIECISGCREYCQTVWTGTWTRIR